MSLVVYTLYVCIKILLNAQDKMELNTWKTQSGLGSTQMRLKLEPQELYVHVIGVQLVTSRLPCYQYMYVFIKL